jgi:hypothetical protein
VNSSTTELKRRSELTGKQIGGGLTLLRVRASSAARVLLASVFLLSGISKLQSPGGASAFVAGILLTSAHTAQIIVIPLSLAELAAGCLFLLNRWVATLALLSSSVRRSRAVALGICLRRKQMNGLY